jgi:hypothetical protein
MKIVPDFLAKRAGLGPNSVLKLHGGPHYPAKGGMVRGGAVVQLNTAFGSPER